jgi:hypothetical protein
MGHFVRVIEHPQPSDFIVVAGTVPRYLPLLRRIKVFSLKFVSSVTYP